MTTIRSDYHVYLLRLWRDDEATPWRIQAEAPHTGEVLAFADLESLFIFLKRLTGRDPFPTEDDRRGL